MSVLPFDNVSLLVQDMWFYLSEHEKFNDFGSEGALVWHETNIPYAVWGPESTRSLSLKYYPSEVVNVHSKDYFLWVTFECILLIF